MEMLLKLEAIEAIRLLKAKYFRFVDEKRWAELRELFVPDATLHFTYRDKNPLPLDVALARFQEVLTAGVISVHHGHMPEIEILDQDHATGIWAMEDRLYFPKTPADPNGPPNLVGFGFYYESYLRVAGKWCIQTLRLDRLRVETISQSP